MTEDPLEEFLDKTEPLAAEAESAADRDGPRVPFPSMLKLTGTQEAAMVEHAFLRLSAMEEELGRNSTSEDEWYLQATEETESAGRSFLGKRQLYKQVYANNVEWRPAILGGIFEESNLVVPLARRIARQMIARANNYFFGSDPWFACHPVGGEEDRALASQVEKLSRYKLEKSGTTDELRSAVEDAFIKGECVVKTVHRVDDDYSISLSEVLVDLDGNQILDGQGNPITARERWIADEAGQWVLKRAPSIVRPLEFQTKMMPLHRRIVHYEGPETTIVHERDIMIPLTASSIQDADIIAHLYDRPVMDLVDFYQRRDMLDASTEERREATARAIGMIKSLAGSTGTHAAASGALVELDETDAGPDQSGQPIAQIVEFHLTYDANGDGFLEEIMLICDRATRLPIFYDYQANVTPDGRRPFEVIRINRIPGRWYGIGAIEMFESTQNIIDLLVNRMNFSQGSSGRLDLFRPYNTLEGDINPRLELNRGVTLTPKPGMRKEDILESVYLNDIKTAEIQALVEFFMQMAMNESGVQHANDAFVAGLDSQKLATGIRNIEAAAQEMFGLYLTNLRPGIQGAVQRSIYYLLAYMRQEETFVYFEGTEMLTGTVDPENVRDLDTDVRLLLTRERGEQILASNAQALDILDRFDILPPHQQQARLPLFIEMLGAMQITNAENILVPNTPEQYMALHPELQPAQAQPSPAAPVTAAA